MKAGLEQLRQVNRNKTLRMSPRIMGMLRVAEGWIAYVIAKSVSALYFQ